jgi:hypothetical protein
MYIWQDNNLKYICWFLSEKKYMKKLQRSFHTDYLDLIQSVMAGPENICETFLSSIFNYSDIFIKTPLFAIKIQLKITKSCIVFYMDIYEFL